MTEMEIGREGETERDRQRKKIKRIQRERKLERKKETK